MPITYEAIAEVSVGAGGSGSIEFASIPQTYTDILLVMSLRTSGASEQDQVNLRVNFDSTANIYSTLTLTGAGSGGASSTTNTGNNMELSWAPGANQTANVFGQHGVYICNYAVAQNKPMSIEQINEGNNSLVYGQRLSRGLYSSNTAITSVQIYCFGSIFVQYSTATLYGIKKP